MRSRACDSHNGVQDYCVWHYRHLCCQEKFAFVEKQGLLINYAYWSSKKCGRRPEVNCRRILSSAVWKNDDWCMQRRCKLEKTEKTFACAVKFVCARARNTVFIAAIRLAGVLYSGIKIKTSQMYVKPGCGRCGIFWSSKTLWKFSRACATQIRWDHEGLV